MFNCRVPSTVVAAVALTVALCAPACAYLRIHPQNPHYFQETTTGKAVLVIGHGSIVPSDTSYDYVNDPGGISTLLARRITWARVWHFLPWSGSAAVWPWARSSTPGAPMGGNRIDMNSWDPAYWTRMNDALSRAGTGGAYSEIHLFDRCGMSPEGMDRWGGNPWARDNNNNNLETPNGAPPNDGTPEFYQWSTKPNLRNQQERYVRKMIDETIANENVIYEVENEHWESPSIGWADHYAQFVKDYIAANYPTMPRLVSYSSIESEADLDACYSVSSIDIINQHYGQEPESNPAIVNTYLEPRWSYNKAINVDEFGNFLTDVNILRQICWTIVTSGGNFHVEDADDAICYTVIENIRSFLALSGWNFIGAAPNKNLVTSGGGYCMAQPGVEYVCYFPSGGGKTVNLAAGTYRAEWWNPRDGGFYNVTTFSHGGGGKALASPDSSACVLHVTTQAAPTTILQARAAGAITIDGSSGDWNLWEFPGKIGAGDVGAGQFALIGYDTNGVCYQGNHAAGYQYPPANAADHTAKVYSRSDGSYLYFLIRCDDSDIRYPNTVDTNWANDCVEFYIDPGHDHGPTTMSSSSSDVQLVIDANNQKNVYMTTPTYRTQVLAGVTSAVARDASGWWLEARISKVAFDPDIPANGTIGVDFNIRDNDNNGDAAQTTIYTWRESSNAGTFPSKIPDRWGDLSMSSSDTTPPGPVTSFTATPGAGQVTLNWHTPSDADYTGTLIRYKTTGYPTGPTDGFLVADEPGSPNTNDSYAHTGLTGGLTYYYAAFAHDGAPNYATAATASATPTAPAVYWNTLGSQLTVGNGYTPGVAVDSQGNIHVVYMGGGHVYYRQATSSLVFGPVEQLPDPPEGAADYCCPCVKCDANDVPHVSFQRGFAGDSHRVWYSNRIGGTWKTPVKIIDNNLLGLDGRANYSRMSLYGSYAFVSVFGVPGEMTDGSEGTIVRVTNLSTTPAVDRAAYSPLWVPHVMAATDGRLFVAGRYGTQGVQYRQYDLNLSTVGGYNLLTGGMERYPGEENGECIDLDNVIHVAGAVNLAHGTGTWLGHVFYNSSTRVNQGKSPIVGIEGTRSWDSIQVYPTVASDPERKVYVSWWLDPTGGAKITTINGDSYATPVTYASSATQYMRWNAQIAPTPTGGVYAAWDSGGVCYLRGIGVGSFAPDTTPPSAVTGFTATGGSGKVTLNWTNPSEPDFQATTIRFKTTGYPTGPTDGTLLLDKAGTPGSAGSHIHTGLTGGLTYYYAAFAHDEVPNYSTAATASATPTGSGVTVPTLVAKAAGTITIDGGASDWNIAQFTEKAHGGIAEEGDTALVGFDPSTGSGQLYYAGHWTDAVLPAIASDHTAKVYCRHSTSYIYLLVRCDDADLRYPYAVDQNWANDCVEFYIDPGHDHGSIGLTHPGTSASDIQLVIDAYNRKNAYCSTSAYASQVLAGVTSAVVRDSTGWWLEMRITKSALDPDMPASGTIGIDFNFRDNDNNNDPTASTCYDWSDTETSSGFPSKIPNRWGNLVLPDVTGPGPVTGFQTVVGNQLNNLMWTNPADADFAGVKILAKTTGYPTNANDGTVVYQGTGTSCAHSGLTNGQLWYYGAYAYDAAPNYSTGVLSSGTPIYLGPIEAKLRANSAATTLTAGYVSAVSTDWFYVQCAGSMPGLTGIRVAKAGHGLTVGQSAGAKGTMLTDATTGERYISATWVKGSGDLNVPPHGMSNAELGGANWSYNQSTGAGQRGVVDSQGPNNVGTLVRVYGKVTQRDTVGLQYFYIDDGSGIMDTTQTGGVANVGVRVPANPTGYSAGDFVVVTGVSSCFKDGSGNLRRLVIPRQGEIQKILP